MPEALQNGEDTAVSVSESVREAIQSLQDVEEPVEPQEPVVEPTDLPEDEPAEEPAEEPSEEPAEEPEAEPVEAVLAPASWSKEDREIFAKLDPEAQKIVARRESERDKALQDAKREPEADPLHKAANEFGDYFKQLGVTPDQSFRALIQAERALRFGTPEGKEMALRKIAQDYGIPLGAPAEADEADPGLARIEKVVSERLGKIEGQLTSRQQAEDSTKQAAAEATAGQFFERLDSAKPDEFPEARYADQVMPRFQAMVTAELNNGTPLDVDGLVELYRGAAYSLPDVRDAIEGDKTARQEAARKAAESRTTRTVKKKSSSASGGSGVVAHSESQPDTMSVRESVRRSIKQLESSQ